MQGHLFQVAQFAHLLKLIMQLFHHQIKPFWRVKREIPTTGTSSRTGKPTFFLGRASFVFNFPVKSSLQSGKPAHRFLDCRYSYQYHWQYRPASALTYPKNLIQTATKLSRPEFRWRSLGETAVSRDPHKEYPPSPSWEVISNGRSSVRITFIANTKEFPRACCPKTTPEI